MQDREMNHASAQRAYERQLRRLGKAKGGRQRRKKQPGVKCIGERDQPAFGIPIAPKGDQGFQKDKK